MPDESSDSLVLGRNQFDLLTGALEGVLALLVEDWTADAPVARDPWNPRPQEHFHQTSPVWAAIDQARGVLRASEVWLAQQDNGG